MTEENNIQLIKTAYIAFGQEDEQGLLKAVSDDIEFHPMMPGDVLKAVDI